MASDKNLIRLILRVAGCAFFVALYWFSMAEAYPCTVWGWVAACLGSILFIIVWEGLIKLGEKISKEKFSGLRILILFPLMIILVVGIPVVLVLFLGDFFDVHFCEW
jgi:hypothetical protein